MNSNKEVLDFYDNFKAKLIQDFIKPNLRIENAIKLALKSIPVKSKSILDLGFGLGWSSYEIARHFPNAVVKAFDISKELTNSAKDLFKVSNLSYNTMDLTQFFPDGSFDVIILLDVFEHIPISARESFYANIKNTLNKEGRVILTCPTIFHQNYLRENNPEGLQPVDENIDIDVILDFASKTETNLAHFEYLDIWNSRDYLFAIIERPYKYHTNQINQYEKEINLLDFYSKYSLLRASNLPNNLLPDLSLKQKLKLQLKPSSN